ncbi:MAG TPA: adenylate/guanylate cyclase domain-containing protein [Nocardioidaceae bacterium]
MPRTLSDPRWPPTGHPDEPALWPYAPRVLADWLTRTPQEVHREVDGTLLFADISGFTRLTERLSRSGKVGAEEMSDALDATFDALLGVAAGYGADLIKWGGDAVLLLFDGPNHPVRAVGAAHGMRERLRTVGRLQTSVGRATLRMSVGIHSGPVQLFLVGDPALHRELLICGPGVSRVVDNEAAAQAGQILVGESTASLLDPGLLGAEAAGLGRLLRRAPVDARAPRAVPGAPDVDVRLGLPVAIREHLLLGMGEAEHRDIAVAFVAFSGTDALLVEQGAEATAAALDACIRNVTRAVADHGVTFFESDINRDGGKLMLTAGAPTSAGHDAERLLRAVRQVVERAGILPLRAGVNLGHVFSGDFGPVFRRTYSVKGDAINLAARLVAKAAPGQVLATEKVVAASRTAFVTRTLPPFAVKGKAKQVTALDVGPLAEPTVGLDLSASPLRGRDAEMATLDGLLDRLRGRAGAVVEVVGEPGIGKSRLLGEVAARALEGPGPAWMPVLSVQSDEYESSTPYHSFRLLLRDLLGLRSDAASETVCERLTSRVRDNGPALLPWLPLVGGLLGVTVEDTDATSGLGDEFRKRRLEEVTGDLLRLLLPTPSVLLFDDAHHMDGASADLLNHLGSRVAGEPWLVVVGRRDTAQGWQPAAGVPLTTLRLGPLGEEDAIRLLQEAVAANPLPRPTLAALAARSGGNPLFLESLVHAAGSAGDVEDLPESVKDLVTAQVDRLAPRDRVVLRYASVFGLRFEAADLRDLVEGHAPTPDDSTFRRLGEFVGASRDGAMRFRHSLIREVAYDGLPYRVRERLHEHVAQALERRDKSHRSPELLSVHFFHAKRFDKAWDYSVRAARLARAKYANQEAVELFTRALESERRGPKGLVAPEDLGAVLEELGDTWFTIGLPEQAADAYRRARRWLADDPVHAARVIAKEARVDHRLRRLSTSLRRVSRGLRMLEQVPGRWASSARSLLAMRYAISRFSQGRVEEALQWANQAVTDAEEAVDKATLAQAYATLHNIYVSSGRPAPMPYGELALRAYQELGDLPHQADCTNNLAVGALDANRWAEASENFRAAAAIYRRIGDTHGEGLALFNRAEVLVKQGRLDEAAPLLDEALHAGRAVSDDELVALVLRETGRAASYRGADEEALARLAEARALFAEIEEPDEVLTTELAICEALLLAGREQDCLEHSDGVLADPLLAEDPSPLATLRRIRGWALVSLDLADRAVPEFRAGLAAAEEEDDRYAVALNRLGLVVALGDGADPGGGVHAARAVLDELGVVAVPLPGNPSAAPPQGAGLTAT